MRMGWSFSLSVYEYKCVWILPLNWHVALLPKCIRAPLHEDIVLKTADLSMVLSFLGVCKTTTKLRINIILLCVCKITNETLHNTQSSYVGMQGHRWSFSHAKSFYVCVPKKSLALLMTHKSFLRVCMQEIPSLKHTLNTNHNHHLTYFNHHLNLFPK